MNNIAVILGFLAMLWIVANVAGWLSIKIGPRGEGYPFSWRIFLGPKRYIDWAWDRRAEWDQ